MLHASRCALASLLPPCLRFACFTRNLGHEHTSHIACILVFSSGFLACHLPARHSSRQQSSSPALLSELWSQNHSLIMVAGWYPMLPLLAVISQ
jgi:hypothetical protein